MKTSKTFSLIALVAMFLAIGLSSCIPNPNKKKIVGTWKYTYSNTQSSDDGSGDINYLYEGTTTFTDAGTVLEKGDATFSMTITDEESYLDGVNVTLKYHIVCSGTYNITTSTLTQKANDVDISFVSASTNITYGYDKVERELIKVYRQALEQNNYAELKKSIYDTDTYEIINISKTKMVLKNSDGEIVEYYKKY